MPLQRPDFAALARYARVGLSAKSCRDTCFGTEAREAGETCLLQLRKKERLEDLFREFVGVHGSTA